MTDHDFILARKDVRDIIAKHSASGWDDFLDSTDGFEVRAFAIQYESAALKAKLGLIDEATLVQTLGFTIVVDWMAIRPALAVLEKAWGPMTFPNFQELAEHSERYWRERGVVLPSPDSLIPRDRSVSG